MAKYTVTRACGHAEVVSLIGKTSKRDWRLENVEPSKLCEECYRAELAAQREKENIEAAEAAKEMNLPQLTGTKKQVAWAETIRQQLLGDIDEFIYKELRGEKCNDPQIREAVEHIKGKTAARWWIDNRGIDMPYRFRSLLEAAVKEVKAEKIAPSPEVVANAKAEATVRPENPVTATVAEIRALDDAIEIDFPEKRDDFWQIVKKRLRMKWTGQCWRRRLIDTNGAPADRVAEAGHRLLAAGFSIRVYDEGLRTRAVAGEYEQECTSWVMARVEGEYTGWFVIRWDREDDFYKVARRIRGSRYSKPNVVVPPEQFDEVLDFADVYGFKLSPGAREVVEASQQAKENILVAKVTPPAERQRATVDGKPQKLEIPDEVEIADEFKD